jgi:hypothetical protein
VGAFVGGCKDFSIVDSSYCIISLVLVHGIVSLN